MNVSETRRSASRRASSVVAAFVFVGGFAGGGCDSKPKPGDSCKHTDIHCLDAKTELICQAGFFAPAPCKGPKGCRETQDRLLCDFTGNVTGDVCALSEDGNGQCLADKKTWVVCRAGTYRVEPCRGEKGCHKHEGTLRCDQSIAAEGEPCTGGSSSCSVDAKHVVACREGRFEKSADCPGKDGCRIASGSITCDQKKEKDGP